VRLKVSIRHGRRVARAAGHGVGVQGRRGVRRLGKYSHSYSRSLAKLVARVSRRVHHHVAKRPHEYLHQHVRWYQRWHGYRHRNMVHAAFLVVYVFGVLGLVLNVYRTVYALPDLFDNWDATPIRPLCSIWMKPAVPARPIRRAIITPVRLLAVRSAPAI
jgi:hypothetical protein